MKKLLYLVLATHILVCHAGSYDDFFRAVVRDDPGAVQGWIAKGFDPNARDPAGQPALHRALVAESFEAAMALAQAPGLDPNVRNRVGETPLMMAALKGQIDICRVLIGRGAEVDPGAGWTPLHYAAAGNSLPVTKLLLEQGARVDARSPSRSTALMQAAQYAAEEVIGTLLASGADPALRDKNDATAADFARTQGRDKLGAELDRRASAALRTPP